MRPLRPCCGTVSKAQLLTLPATISASAKGVVTTQLSFLPPASSTATEVLGVLGKPARHRAAAGTAAHHHKIECIRHAYSPRLFLLVIRDGPGLLDLVPRALHRPGMTSTGSPASGFQSWAFAPVSGKSGSMRADPAQQTRVSAVIKSSKDRHRAFPKRVHVGTYRSHPMASAKGSLLRKPPDRTDRRPRALRQIRFGTGF